MVLPIGRVNTELKTKREKKSLILNKDCWVYMCGYSPTLNNYEKLNIVVNIII